MNSMRTILLLIGSVLSLASHATESARVGMIEENGRVRLDVQRFQQAFPNGMSVDTIDVRISNGLAHVFRTHETETGCRSEQLVLTDESGDPIRVTKAYLPGAGAFLFDVQPTTIVPCQDDGCHALKNVVPPGGQPLLSAKCDQTELSGYSCKCHINDGTGERITQGSFCKSWINSVSTHLNSWVKWQYILAN